MFVEMDVGGCDGENVTVGDLAVAELLLADKADRCVLGGDCSGDVATVDAVLELADWSGVLGGRIEEVVLELADRWFLGGDRSGVLGDWRDGDGEVTFFVSCRSERFTPWNERSSKYDWGDSLYLFFM